MTSRRWSWGRARWVWWCHEVNGQINSTVLTAQWKVIRQTECMREVTALLFITTDLQKGRRGGSLSNTKKQSTNPVQKPAANEDREPESLDQTLASFGRGWVSLYPTKVCSQSQREGDVLSIYLCVRSCMCVCVQIWHHYSQVGDYSYP